jgi:anti-anti-sigma factor
MSTAGTTGSGWVHAGSDDEFPSQPWESRTARFAAHRGPAAVVVAAQGELDAANAVQLADYVQRCAAFSQWVILDLTGLKFFGTAGFSALHTINVRCAGAGVRWTVVPNRTVSRLLRICDPDQALPIYGSPTGDSFGYSAVRDEPRRLLQLVPQPR